MAKKKTLKLATFNLYNLQLPEEKIYGRKGYTQKEYDAKLEWTAETLRQLDADIIAFQELWDPKCLKKVFSKANLSGKYELVAEKINAKGTDNALAVRKPHKVVRLEWIKEFPKETILKKRGRRSEPDYQLSLNINNFSRALLYAIVEVIPARNVQPVKLKVLVAHLKSKLPMRLDSKYDRAIKAHATALGQAMSSIRRTAESAALRVFLNKRMRGNDNPIVVLGDLNNTENSVSVEIVTGQPKFRQFASSRVGRKNDTGLYPASFMQGHRSIKDVVFTHIFNGRRETLDHILVSEQFYDYSNKRIWSFNNLRCFNDYLDDEKKETSDHAVVSATFDYNPAR